MREDEGLYCRSADPDLVDLEHLENLHQELRRYSSSEPTRLKFLEHVPWEELHNTGTSTLPLVFLTFLNTIGPIISSPVVAETSTSGFWKARDAGWGVIRYWYAAWGIGGYKRTYDYYTGTTVTDKNGERRPAPTSKKTRWTMNLYCEIGDNLIAEGLVLCHVFENESGSKYEHRPKCACHAKHNGEGDPCSHAISDQSNHSFWATAPGCSPLPHNFDQPLTPYSVGIVETLKNQFSSPTPAVSHHQGHETNGESGPSKKRTRSAVWELFTIFFVTVGVTTDSGDPRKKKNTDSGAESRTVRMAICNHCCMVYKADSNQGTSHLTRHVCHCRPKPSSLECHNNGIVSDFPS